MPKRSLLIDLLRTLAIAMMVIYHTAFDLAYFYSWDIDVYRGGWWLLARSSAVLFLALVGASFWMSWEKRVRAGARVWKYYFFRGLKIFLLGMVVTIVTYVMDPNTYIRFGILHCIGVSIMLLPLFVRFGYWNLIIGIGIMYLGTVVKTILLSYQWLLPLGLRPVGFASLDYFPLLPWFGVVLFGLGLGVGVGHRIRTANTYSSTFKIFTFPGRHSLLMYLLHQPVIIGCLWILSRIY